VLGTGLPARGGRAHPLRPAAILINTHTALREVDPDIVEAGLGQGMTDRQLMRRIKVPLALPVIFAGIRTAAVRSCRPPRSRRSSAAAGWAS
jgi:osmoprotectant transport system permease protein